MHQFCFFIIRNDIYCLKFTIFASKSQYTNGKLDLCVIIILFYTSTMLVLLGEEKK